MNSLSTLTLLVLVTAISVALLAAYRRLLRTAESLGAGRIVDTDPLDSYAPMLRLVGNRDLEFLLAHPGATPLMIERLRQRHYLVFRCYLEAMETDFQRTTCSLMLLLLASPTDRADLAHLLVRSEILFTERLLILRARLFLYRWGMATVNPSSLIRVFDAVQRHLRSLDDAPEPGNA